MTPSDGNAVSLSSVDLAGRVTTRRMSTVTPHEHEASLALAALCMQSDQRKGIAPQPMSQYLGKDVKLPKKKQDIAFPELVHAIVTEMSASSPDVMQWVNNGEAFMVHEPKVSVSLLLVFHSLLHHTTISRRLLFRVVSWQRP